MNEFDLPPEEFARRLEKELPASAGAEQPEERRRDEPPPRPALPIPWLRLAIALLSVGLLAWLCYHASGRGNSNPWVGFLVFLEGAVGILTLVSGRLYAGHARSKWVSSPSSPWGGYTEYEDPRRVRGWLARAVGLAFLAPPGLFAWLPPEQAEGAALGSTLLCFVLLAVVALLFRERS